MEVYIRVVEIEGKVQRFVGWVVVGEKSTSVCGPRPRQVGAWRG
jgi:hypothetical protein